MAACRQTSKIGKAMWLRKQPNASRGLGSVELGVTANENKVSLGEEKKVLELAAVIMGLSSSVEAH